MQVQALGHVVLKVRISRAPEDFYSGTLGMRVISRLADPRMTFFTLETQRTITTSPSWSSVRRANAGGRRHGARSRGVQGRELT